MEVNIPIYPITNSNGNAQKNFKTQRIPYNPIQKLPGYVSWNNDKRHFGTLVPGDKFLLLNEHDDYRTLDLCEKIGVVPIDSYDDKNDITHITTELGKLEILGDYRSSEGFMTAKIFDTVILPEEFDMKKELCLTRGCRFENLATEKNKSKLAYLRSFTNPTKPLGAYLNSSAQQTGVIAVRDIKRNPYGVICKYIWSQCYHQPDAAGDLLWDQCYIDNTGLTQTMEGHRDFVYIIESVVSTPPVYKIGRAEDPNDRMGQYIGSTIMDKPSLQYRIRLVKPDGRLEKLWHTKFAEHWIPPLNKYESKERFRHCQEIEDFINTENGITMNLVSRFNHDRIRRPESVIKFKSHDKSHTQCMTELGLEEQLSIFPNKH